MNVMRVATSDGSVKAIGLHIATAHIRNVLAEVRRYFRRCVVPQLSHRGNLAISSSTNLVFHQDRPTGSPPVQNALNTG